MNRYSVFVCSAVLLLAPVSFAAKDNVKHKEPAGPAVQAVLLDHNEYPCVNCLFGMSDYYFCFDVNSKIMVGHERIRTQMRKQLPTELMERGKTVPVRFDDKFIWVPETGKNGKVHDVPLVQDYTRKIFLENDRCQAATK